MNELLPFMNELLHVVYHSILCDYMCESEGQQTVQQLGWRKNISEFKDFKWQLYVAFRYIFSNIVWYA